MLRPAMRRQTLRDSRWTWIVLSSVFLFGVLPYVLKKLSFTQSLSEGIYIGTGVAIVWYTVETYYLRREMLRQNQISVAPLVITQVGWVKNDRGKEEEMLLLRNIGRGPALYAKIEDIKINATDIGELSVKFNVTDIIEPSQEVVASVHGDLGGAKLWSFVPSLTPAYANADYVVKIAYQDWSGQSHTSEMQMGKSGIRLLRHT